MNNSKLTYKSRDDWQAYERTYGAHLRFRDKLEKEKEKPKSFSILNQLIKLEAAPMAKFSCPSQDSSIIGKKELDFVKAIRQAKAKGDKVGF